MSSPLVRRCVNGLCDHVGALKPGVALDGEARLGELLGVSRSPLRQALVHLAARGVVVREGRRTTLRRPVRVADRLLDAGPLTKTAAFESWFLSAISRRHLRPGRRFTEVEVAEAAGVTTATAREVLARYEARRLITKDPRRSWRMIRFDAQVIAELWQVRRLVEHHALERLCQGGAARKDARIIDLLAEHRSFAARKQWPLEVFRDLDRRFHRTLSVACPNRFLGDLRAMIDLLIHVQLADDAIGREGMRRGLAEHSAILAAVVAGDRGEARKALDRHLDSSELIMNRAANRDHED